MKGKSSGGKWLSCVCARIKRRWAEHEKAMGGGGGVFMCLGLVRVFCCIHVQPCTPPPVCRSGSEWWRWWGVSVWLHLGLMHTFILHPQHRGEPWPLSIWAKGVGMSGNGFQAWGITWPETFFIESPMQWWFLFFFFLFHIWKWLIFVSHLMSISKTCVGCVGYVWYSLHMKYESFAPSKKN